MWNNPSPPLPSLLFNVMEAQSLSYFADISFCSRLSFSGRHVVQVLITVCLIIPSFTLTFQALLLFGAKDRAEGPDVSSVSSAWRLGPKIWALGEAHILFCIKCAPFLCVCLRHWKDNSLLAGLSKRLGAYIFPTLISSSRPKGNLEKPSFLC